MVIILILPLPVRWAADSNFIQSIFAKCAIDSVNVLNLNLNLIHLMTSRLIGPLQNHTVNYQFLFIQWPDYSVLNAVYLNILSHLYNFFLIFLFLFCFDTKCKTFCPKWFRLPNKVLKRNDTESDYRYFYCIVNRNYSSIVSYGNNDRYPVSTLVLDSV